MNINFGPKFPNREVCIKVGQQLLRIASGKIQDAAWATVQDSGVRGFDVSDLHCISYDSELSIFEGDTICYTLWKQPKKCKYLVMWENIHDFGAFLLQGGSNTSLMTKTGLIACLAKSCYVVFKKAKRLSTNTADEIFCTAPEKVFPQSVEATLQTAQDVLKLVCHVPSALQSLLFQRYKLESNHRWHHPGTAFPYASQRQATVALVDRKGSKLGNQQFQT